MNIKENEKNFTLELAVPGMDKKDLKIDINEDVLTISSEMKNESEEDRMAIREKNSATHLSAGAFTCLEIQTGKKIAASYKDGILMC